MTSAQPRSLTWRTLPWHPVLLAAVVVVSFWMDAVVSPYAAVRSLVIAVLATTALTVGGSALLRNRHLAGGLVTGLIGLFYTKHLVRLITDLGPQMPLPVLLVWLAAMALVAAIGVRLAVRAMRRIAWTETTWVLNRVAMVLLIATLLGGVLGGAFARGAAQLEQGGPLPSADAPGAAVEGRDIYVILLDGYPRADVLEWAFGIDNTAFLRELQERGFDVAEQARSDYLWTHVTLASLLNMAYVEQIEGLADVVDGRAPLFPRLTETVNHNPVFDLARAEGYQVVAISGGFEQLALRRADVFLDAPEMSEFEVKLLNSTWLGDAISTAAPRLAALQHGNRIRSTLNLLGEVARAPHSAPRLVLAHVPTPHQPSVFTRVGEPLAVPMDDSFYADSAQQKGQSLAQFTAEYRDHLAYVNDLVLSALDDVLAASDEPPVVIFLADHGSASRVDWRIVQPNEADPALLLERTGTLFAALTPGKSGVFPDDIAPVNVFRHLFDAYFGTDYGDAVPPPGGGQIPPVDAAVLK